MTTLTVASGTISAVKMCEVPSMSTWILVTAHVPYRSTAAPCLIFMMSVLKIVFPPSMTRMTQQTCSLLVSQLHPHHLEKNHK